MNPEGFREEVTARKRASGTGCGDGGKRTGWFWSLPFACSMDELRSGGDEPAATPWESAGLG